MFAHLLRTTEYTTHWEQLCVWIFPFYSCLAWYPQKCYRLWKWMAFRFDSVSHSASCVGVMTITVKRECICASPLSSSCLFLWPFEINTPCTTFHFAAQSTWWWWWWWYIYSRGGDWTNNFILSHTITWFYCLIFMSLKLLSVSAFAPVLLFVINPLFSTSLHLPSSFYLLSLHQLCLSFPLNPTPSTPPSLSVSLSPVLIVTQLSGCQF